MQLLEEDVLLLKYSSEDVANQTHSDPNSKMCLFVFFNYVSILYTLAYTCLHLPTSAIFVFFNYVSILYTLAYTCLHLPPTPPTPPYISLNLPTTNYTCLQLTTPAYY